MSAIMLTNTDLFKLKTENNLKTLNVVLRLYGIHISKQIEEGVIRIKPLHPLEMKTPVKTNAKSNLLLKQ